MAGAPVCLVTGSATGIGAACAREFARRGWNVVVTHLGEAQRADAEAVAADCTQAGASVLLQPLDVTDDASCAQAARAALQRFSCLDALVNCAGTTRFIPHAELDALDADEFHRTYGVNVVGVHQMVRACAGALRASEAGAVVNISSIGGVLGRGSSMAYAASKGALNTLTLVLARALAPAIRVNAIAPGFVDGGLPSRVLDAANHAQVLDAQTRASVLARVSQPEEVAALAFFIAARAPGMTGEVIQLDNGLHLNAG
jgi:NAD(P)-dependent dehydrogenase (short-subunit alcohol dehydrogenase family)